MPEMMMDFTFVAEHVYLRGKFLQPMRSFCTLTASLFLCLSFVAHGQKLKYKDIFPVVQAGQWDEAEKQLKVFISDPKNNEEANALYNMGRVYERKALAANIVTDSALLFNYIDSAAIYFNRSLTLIDEKELKKNDEFYQEFNRRDLRTGEFGIKVSDVHLDIENKAKALESRKVNVISFLKEAGTAGTFYSQAGDKMLAFKKQFSNQSIFGLALSKDIEKEFAELEKLASQMETSIANAEKALAAIPAPGISHSLTKMPLADIADFTKGALDLTASGEVSYYDLKGWTEMTRADVKARVEPFRQQLIAYDRELVAKRQQVAQDPSGQEVPAEINPSLFTSMQQFGGKLLSERIIGFRVEELNYLVESQPSALPDSSRVDDLYLAVNQIVSRLNKMNSLITVSKKEAEQGFQSNPVFFESRYVSVDQLVAYTEERKSFVDLEMSTWAKAEEILKRRRGWLFSADSDSIPLMVMDSVTIPTSFSPLHIADSAGLYVTGIRPVGKDLLFFMAKASPSYNVEWMLDEKLPLPDKEVVFKPVNADHSPTAEGYRTFYIHYPLKDKTHFFISTVDETGKPLWKASLALDRPPVNVSFNKMVMETIVYLEKPQGDPTNDLSYIVIDRTGKVRK